MKHILPKIISTSYKGQNGRLAVIGGCLEYTGAPYYSSISQLKGGCDLGHIFCTKQAGVPIKAYSPEIITHPYLQAYNEQENHEILSLDEIEQKFKKSKSLIQDWSDALHGFVIGPGLGRDKWIEQYLGGVIENFQKQQIILFDGDGIWYFAQDYSTYSKEGKIYKNFVSKDPQYHIITPNQPEFERLWNTFMEGSQQSQSEDRIRQMESFIKKYYEGDENQSKNSQSDSKTNPGNLQYQEIKDLGNPLVTDAVELAKQLNHINIVQKGMIDVITNGKKAYAVVEKGSQKRIGGMGDINAGLVGLYSYWAQRAFNDRNENKDEKESKEKKEIEGLDERTFILLGCVLGSCITRKSSYEAYKKHEFGLTAPNVIDYIGPSFMKVYNNLMMNSNQKL